MTCTALLNQSPLLRILTAIVVITASFTLTGCRDNENYGKGNKRTLSTSELKLIGLDDISKKNFQHADSVGRALMERARINPGDREAAIYGNIIAG